MSNQIKKHLPLWLVIKLANFRHSLIYHNPFVKKKIIIGRNACLGNELLRNWLKNNHDFLVINQQKTRVDLFLDRVSGAPQPKADIIKKYFRLKRADLDEIIKQQEKLPWLANKRPVKYLVMDSFAELTDKKFTHKKEDWSFTCFWNDLSHDENFERTFSAQDMLPLDDLEKSYADFFDWAAEKYPGIKIFFIHYPDNLEKREKYLERSRKIKEVLLKLASQKPFVENIILSSAAEKNPADEFPYHYGPKVYDELTEKLTIALKKNTI
jgi:hypothetical protein